MNYIFTVLLLGVLTMLHIIVLKYLYNKNHEQFGFYFLGTSTVKMIVSFAIIQFLHGESFKTDTSLKVFNVLIFVVFLIIEILFAFKLLKKQ